MEDLGPLSVERVPASVLAGGLAEASARGIAQHVADLIRRGCLANGVRLPTVRALAAAVHVGPTTVANAWSLLQEEHLVRSDGRNGTFVRDLSTHPDGAPDREVPVRLDLSGPTYDAELTPDPMPHLRQATEGLAWHLCDTSEVQTDLADAAYASWPYPPEALAVAWGYADALAHLVDLAVRPGDRILVEAACSPDTSAVLRAARAQLVRVDCDEDGMLPDALAEALGSRPVMVVMQPRMADPLAHRITRCRAEALATVLAGHDVLVVEEDSSAGLAPLDGASVGAWLPDRSVLIRDYQRAHGPRLRIALVGGPASVLERIRGRQEVTGSFPTLVLQRTLALMLRDQEVQDLVATARSRYLRRWQALARALRARGVCVRGVEGLALWVPVADAQGVCRRLGGLGIRAGTGIDLAGPVTGAHHLRLTTTGLRCKHDTVARLVAGTAALSAGETTVADPVRASVAG